MAWDPGEAAVGVVGHEEGETGPEPKHFAHGRVLGVDVVARFQRLEAEPAAPGRYDDRKHGCTRALESCGGVLARFF